MKVSNNYSVTFTGKLSSIRQVVISVALVGLLATAANALARNSDPAADADLFEMPIEELMEIEVTSASKKTEPLSEAPGVMAVVPREEIVTYGDRNLHQLLRRQASVYTRDDFVYGDNNAGFRGDMSTVAEMHTLILYNGRPIRESAQGHNVNTYMAFPLTNLGSVELIRGPGSVLYGTNAFTGVINLKSRAIPDQNEFSVSSMVGSHGYYEATASGAGRRGELGIVADMRVAGEQGYAYNMSDTAGVYGEDDKKYNSVSGAGHLEYRSLTFDFFGSILDSFALGVVPLWSNPDHSISNRKLFLNLGYRIPLHDRVTLELNATHNLQENMLSRPVSPVVGTNTSDLLGEATIFANPTDNLNVVLGWLQEQRSNYHPDSDQYQSIRSYRHEPKGFYAQGDYKMGKLLKFIAGTQWNKSSYGIADWVSRYGLIITPTDKWGVKLLRGEAFRAPVTLETDLYDPGILVGNSDLVPEEIKTYDAQLFYHDEKTYAAVTYFESTIDKLIIYDTSASPDMSYMNGGVEKFNGIEFEGKHFFTPNWHIFGSFMHQENDGAAGLNPTVVPKQMAKLGTAYTADWGTAAVFLTHFGTPPDITSAVVVNPDPEAQTLLSANVGIDVSKWMGMDKGRSTLTLRVENLFDEKTYAPTFAYTGSPNSFPYGPGRTFYLGLKLSF